jgi:hypothetical protein
VRNAVIDDVLNDLIEVAEPSVVALTTQWTAYLEILFVPGGPTDDAGFN